MRPQALIAGVHEFPERKTARSMLEIQALSARAALEDAGLSKNDVDGYFTVAANPGIGPLPIVDYLNLNPKYIDGTTSNATPRLLPRLATLARPATAAPTRKYGNVHS